VEMAVIINPTGDLKDAGFDHGVSIVPESFVCEVQGSNDGGQLVVERP